MFKISLNKDREICQAYRCSSKKSGDNTLCCKHIKRRKRELNPSAYFFDLLRQNAKQRGKNFSLTLDDFRKFCEETKYLELKGKMGKSASIDRIDHTKRYEAGNIQILSLSENSKKRFEDEKVPF